MRAVYGLGCALVWLWIIIWLFGEEAIRSLDNYKAMLILTLAFAGGCAGGAKQ